jgi:sugar phosphate isomerase/epimerase
MDVCNVINSPVRFYHNAQVITELFQKLGKWVLSCHAKDLKWVPEYNVHFQEVVPGRGQVDYRTYLGELASAPLEAPLMLEHLKTAEEYAEGSEYIRRVGSDVGVTFV